MREPRHETSDVSTRAIWRFAAGLLATLLLVFAGIWGLQRALARAGHVAPARTTTQPAWTPPAPRLQRSPRADLQAWQAEEERTLHSYGWVDRSQGLIRIPLERALELTAQRGLPVRPQPVTPP